MKQKLETIKTAIDENIAYFVTEHHKASAGYWNAYHDAERLEKSTEIEKKGEARIEFDERMNDLVHKCREANKKQFDKARSLVDSIVRAPMSNEAVATLDTLESREVTQTEFDVVASSCFGNYEAERRLEAAIKTKGLFMPAGSLIESHGLQSVLHGIDVAVQHYEKLFGELNVLSEKALSADATLGTGHSYRARLAIKGTALGFFTDVLTSFVDHYSGVPLEVQPDPIYSGVIKDGSNTHSVGIL